MKDILKDTAAPETLRPFQHAEFAHFIAAPVCDGVACGIAKWVGGPEVVADCAQALEGWLDRRAAAAPIVVDDLEAPLAACITARYLLSPDEARALDVAGTARSLLDAWKAADADARRAPYQRVRLSEMDDRTLTGDSTLAYPVELVDDEIRRRIARRKGQMGVQALENALF